VNEKLSLPRKMEFSFDEPKTKEKCGSLKGRSYTAGSAMSKAPCVMIKKERW